MAVVLVHGGASNLAGSPLNAAKQAVTEASCAALTLKGASALDLVEQAVALQELAPELNAGIGAVIQMDGRIRLDAAICDSQGRYGAVIQLEQVANPVKVARRIAQIGYHSILSGDGAKSFAVEQGFALTSLYTEKTFAEYAASRAQYPELSYAALSGNIDDINVKKLSTVGAVALDDDGCLAAACSTGGTKFCFPGRVGDTPILGAGLYASEKVAVAMTGEGDKVLRRLTSLKVDQLLSAGASLQEAVDQAVDDLLKVTNGYCGIIAVSAKGETAVGHSTAFMAHAQQTS